MSIDNIKDTMHRFSDVDKEPCIMLAPIDGFNKKPLVTLEEAIVPLKRVVPRIDTYAHVAKERAGHPANNLTRDESASIALYTMEWEPYVESVYYILNSALRAEDRQILKPWFLYLKLILTALSRLPSVSLIIYRGVRSEIQGGYGKYQNGKDIVWWGFSSCSTSRSISERDQFLGKLGQRTLFIIECINGKDISKHSYYRKEHEVLLLPATSVKVISKEHREDGLHIIHLKEVISSYILLEPVSTEEDIRQLENKNNSKQKTSTSLGFVAETERYFNPKLSKDIARYKPRSEVYLIGRQFSENDMQIVVQQLLNEKECRGLFLRESGITSQGAVVIAKALHNNNTLERLFISHNNIGDIGTEALAKSLIRNTSLKELCLGYNNITDEGIDHLADLLELNKTLTHLWLPSNKISDRGLKRLAEVLTNTNKTLQVLELDWNRFCSDSNVDILVGMLSNNRTLAKLNLNSCELSKSAIKHLKTEAKKKKNFELAIH